jgi:hypothetical protein
MIRRLRKLVGGEWRAERYKFGSLRYHGTVDGHSIVLEARSHLAPRYDGDDETAVVRWHATRDGEPFEPFGWPMSDPAFDIALSHLAGRVKDLSRRLGCDPIPEDDR